MEDELAVRVLEHRVVAADVVELILGATGHAPLPEWTPGAHIDLVLGDQLVRQYSLAGDPADRYRWRLGVLREESGRGGSEFVHTRLAPGDVLRVRGPRNHFELVTARRYIFVAGGIGITPLLPMIAAVNAAGVEWSLLYGGRTRQSMAFCPELEHYGSRITLRPEDEFGLLDLDSLLADPVAGVSIYCCGPEPLLAAIEKIAYRWPEGALHVERFAARPEAFDVPTGGFEVELRRSGLTVHVPPDRSILDVVTAAGVPVLSSCKDGICGTCQTAVLDGVLEHHDSVLSMGERKAGKTMMLCVSRALGPRLVLDI